ncbi:MAG: helix-turn-helix domain-containing protein [Myxococcales bacterium]|nr:helix-turn-helix domain-containing protein [Myxococcales bacterium]
MQSSVELLRDPARVGVLAQPVRVRILEALREPATAASVARGFGRSRQYVSYHLKELERVGLVERVGERRNGNFVEQLYRATARRFVVSGRFAADPVRLESVFRDQVSLAQLSELGEQLQHDCAGLIDQAATEGRRVPSASVCADVRFADEAARNAFMANLVECLKNLLSKHGSAEGEPFRVALAAYPPLEEE